MGVGVRIEPARQVDVERMLRLGEEFALALYPPEACFLLDIAELEVPGIEVFVARDEAVAASIPAAEQPPVAAQLPAAELPPAPEQLPAAELPPVAEPVEAHTSISLALGMVALVDRGDGSGEIKRMFVLASARGRGVARALLRALEARAAERGIRLLQLETGTHHTAALALYTSLGYAHIPRFGPYVASEFSVCMEKSLG